MLKEIPNPIRFGQTPSLFKSSLIALTLELNRYPYLYPKLNSVILRGTFRLLLSLASFFKRFCSYPDIN